MGDPDFVKLVVGKRKYIVSISQYASFLQCQSYHRYSLAGSKWIVDSVTVLSASDYNRQFINSFENVLDGSQMTNVEGLEATNIESGSQLLLPRRIPDSGWANSTVNDRDPFSLKQGTFRDRSLPR